MENSYSKTMGEFWRADLGTKLYLGHDPQAHQYRALEWRSGKLLSGIVGTDHYEERLHDQVVARAEEYKLEVITVESTDSMLGVVLAIDKQAKQEQKEELQMNEQKIWLDHPVYHMYWNEAHYWEAAVLLPASQTSIILNGEETSTATENLVKATCGESSERLSTVQFQEEASRRITHTPVMLELLGNNWTGKDLRSWHVYGSILRPMMGIRIDGTVFLNGNGARHEVNGGKYEIYTYVVAKEPLDVGTINHYTLVEVSHP